MDEADVESAESVYTTPSSWSPSPVRSAFPSPGANASPPQPLRIAVPHATAKRTSATSTLRNSASTARSRYTLVVPAATPLVVSAEPLPTRGPWTTASAILERRGVAVRSSGTSVSGSGDVGSLPSAWSRSEKDEECGEHAKNAVGVSAEGGTPEAGERVRRET